MDSVNAKIAELYNEEVQIKAGEFEGETLPSAFAQTLTLLREEKSESEVDDEESLEENLEETNQGQMSLLEVKVLEEKRREEEAARREIRMKEQAEAKAVKEQEERERVRKEINAILPPIKPEEKVTWGDTEEEEDIPDKKLSRAEVIKAATSVLQNMVGAPIDSWTDMQENLCYYGITLSETEHNVLCRKFESMKSLSLRECVLFLEGVRSANTISEAKMAGHLETLTKTLDSYRAQVQRLEKAVDNYKAQEKKHMDRLAGIEADKEQYLSKIEHKCNVYANEQREKVRIWKEAEEKKAIEEIEEYKKIMRRRGNKTIKDDHQQKSIVGRAKPTSDPAKSSEDMYTSKDSGLGFLSGSDTDSLSQEACGALLAISDGSGMSISSLIKYYKISIDDMNKVLEDFPQTTTGLIEKYETLKGAFQAFNTSVYELRNCK